MHNEMLYECFGPQNRNYFRFKHKRQTNTTDEFEIQVTSIKRWLAEYIFVCGLLCYSINMKYSLICVSKVHVDRGHYDPSIKWWLCQQRDPS